MRNTVNVQRGIDSGPFWKPYTSGHPWAIQFTSSPRTKCLHQFSIDAKQIPTNLAAKNSTYLLSHSF